MSGKGRVKWVGPATAEQILGSFGSCRPPESRVMPDDEEAKALDQQRRRRDWVRHVLLVAGAVPAQATFE